MLPPIRAARKDAELGPLWGGKYDPALIALAVGVPGTQVEQATLLTRGYGLGTG